MKPTGTSWNETKLAKTRLERVTVCSSGSFEAKASHMIF